MKSFITRFRPLVTGILSGFDRIVFQGHLLPLIRRMGMFHFLEQTGVRLLDFKDYALRTTACLKEASRVEAQRFGRPQRYIESPNESKEDLARRLLAEHPTEEGLICHLETIEPCMTFEYQRSKDPAQRGLRLHSGKCLHIYKYYLHPELGFMSGRIQTWFPFKIQICLNGREWLGHQLQREGRNDFKRVDNCFTWLGNPALAQRRMTRQLTANWPRLLQEVARWLNPAHEVIFEAYPLDYYWSAYQTEWATDIMFESPKALAGIYPKLVRHAMEHFKSPDVMRFLAQKAPGNFTGEIVSSFKDRAEGVRVKHWVRGNSVKMYDKAGSVLRVETTLANPKDFKVLRPPHDDPDGPLAWRPLRKGVADLHRRAEVSERANGAYLDALAAVDDARPCSALFDDVSRPVDLDGRRVRALRLSDPNDLALLAAITRGEFATSGFRNRDIRGLLFPSSDNATTPEARKQSAKVSRLLRILRAHGLIRKVPKTHRYRLTERGTLLTTAVRATRSANIKTLLSMAA